MIEACYPNIKKLSLATLWEFECKIIDKNNKFETIPKN
jgi:hypothetical protein